MKIKIEENAKEIIEKLNNNNFDAFLVGGGLRDLLLNKIPYDYDIATNATPVEVTNIFKKEYVVIPTGLAHGTVSVIINKKVYEVTTFRTEGEYLDFRHPKKVKFAPSIYEDLKRRDFTINAFAYNEKEGLIDVFNSKKDLDEKIIRCVGEANERFREDPLRILRAFRFSAKLGFEIEKETLKAAKENACLLNKISKERILNELNQIFSYPFDGGKLFFLPIIIKELNELIGCRQNNIYHDKDVYSHTIESFNSIRPKKELKFAMLLHDIGKPIVKTTDEKGIDHFKNHEEVGSALSKEILKNLKADNKTIRKVEFLIKNHHYPIKEDFVSIKKALSFMGEENLWDLLEVMIADEKGKNLKITKKNIAYLEKVKKNLRLVLLSNEPYALKHLKINGDDLISLGIAKGEKIKFVLQRCLDYIINNPDKNNKEDLILFVKKSLKARQ